MKYAKVKGGCTYVEVDENYNGRSVYVNGKEANIGTYTNGAEGFFLGKVPIYEAIDRKEFDAALLQAKNLLNVL